MELLLSKVRSEVFPDKLMKDIYLCPSVTIDALAEKITPTSPNFGLLLAMDAQSIDSDQIGELAEKMADKGLAYLCAWGPDCERVHDIFDEIVVQRNLELEDNSVMMTAWHPDDQLEESLGFFVNCAFPGPPHEQTCKDWIVAPIGNAAWELRIRATFKVSWADSASKTESA
jgi:hypothetical protein